MFAEGSLVAGKFRIDRFLGKGGMGVVVAATHVQLNQRVALKILRNDAQQNPHILERFVREARAAAALRGEHVCRVTDVGELDDGTPYIVMELLEGTDLSRMLHANGPMPVQRACSYVLQACVGVGEAHSLGIVHRDLKPANLFVAQRPDGTTIVKVLDFGIAKASTDDNQDFTLTSTSAVLGSPGYMSPEQLRSSRNVDLRTDIWSMGVILYELITGKRPFHAHSITELAIRVAVDPRPPFLSPMPHGFEQVIDRCLAKEPDHRYPDLANLAHALAAYAGPDGWELANAVSRMLRVTPMPKAAAAAPMRPLIAGDPAAVPPTGFAVPPTVAATGYHDPAPAPAPPAPTVAQVPPSGALAYPVYAPVETTLGSSAISRDVPAPKSRGRALVPLLVAGLTIGAALTAFFIVRGSGDGPAREHSTPSEPIQPVATPAQPPDASPDAEVAMQTPDAELAESPDAEFASVADAALEPDAAEVAAAPADARTPVRKKLIRKKKRDFGEKRQ